MAENILDFDIPEQGNSIIKVIGVGGGGGNAVNHMYREGIHDVTFVLCNTDNQALNDSPVPVHLQLGKEGLGAGNKPEKARQAAEDYGLHVTHNGMQMVVKNEETLDYKELLWHLLTYRNNC